MVQADDKGDTGYNMIQSLQIEVEIGVVASTSFFLTFWGSKIRGSCQFNKKFTSILIGFTISSEKRIWFN